jgi:D-cysteine desulfhydrase
VIDPRLHPTTREVLLHREFPELARLPFCPMLHGPTPVDNLDHLANYWGRKGIFIKRDEFSSPVYGGNKIRKYEYIFGEVFERGDTHIITTGGLASTQVTATAVLTKAMGLRFTAVLFDQPWTKFGAHAILANQAAGAELVYAGSYWNTFSQAWQAKKTRYPNNSYFIMLGSSTPLPNLGYVDAAFELAEQIRRKEIPQPDAIVLPSGTCGTQAGLALGFAYLGLPIEVIGVRISTVLTGNTAFVRTLSNATARYLKKITSGFQKRKLEPYRVKMFHEAVGPGYGEPTVDSKEGAEMFRQVTGYPGEVTYTGKVMVAMRALARHPDYRTKNLMLWNTLTATPPSIVGSNPRILHPTLRKAVEGPWVA